ncbi:MAG: prephenate dehydratase domain-containing protein, partial [Anaerolineae bacterium]
MPEGTAKTVAFQGEHGAYSEIAVRAIYGPEITSLPCATFKDAFQAVENGDA